MNTQSTYQWQLGKEQWQLPQEGAIMGIVNTTPDSFSDGGQYGELATALAHAEQLIAEGADIIDIGGESTRPGATPTTLEEEHQRTIPLIKALRASQPTARISIDTRHPSIAQAALEAGADILNDITGLAQAEMRQLAAQYRCGVILMHMQGTPETMQQNPSYKDIIAEQRQFFQERISAALAEGVQLAQICIDPGIGFGKTLGHNLQLIKHLSELRPPIDHAQQIPIMMALSRKRFMGEILSNPELGRGTIATLSMSLLSAEQGANIHRVHEVAPLKTALSLRAALQ
ncbi:MAG: dihydropteroate synthase [Akkermansia sp.]